MKMEKDIVIVSDKIVDKNKLLLNIYFSSLNSDSKPIQKKNYISIQKSIKNTEVQAKLYLFNEIDSRHLDSIQRADNIIVLFDINDKDSTSHDSFDNLASWLDFIKSECTYSDKIYIFGSSLQKFNVPLTTKQEVYDKCKLLEVNAEYHDLTEYENEGIVQLMDEIIYETKTECNNSKRDGMSVSGQKCLIF